GSAQGRARPCAGGIGLEVRMVSNTQLVDVGPRKTGNKANPDGTFMAFSIGCMRSMLVASLPSRGAENGRSQSLNSRHLAQGRVPTDVNRLSNPRLGATSSHPPKGWSTRLVNC